MGHRLIHCKFRGHFPLVPGDPVLALVYLRILATMPRPSIWDDKVGIARLVGLPTTPPPPMPDGPALTPGASMEAWMKALHSHAFRAVDPENLDDRRDLWNQTWETIQDCPKWMTLTPQPDLRDYETLLVKDLQMGNQAIEPFITLARRGPLGYSEACRVLHHGLKDKRLGPDASLRFNLDEDGRDIDPRRKAIWFRRTSEESLEALNNTGAWLQMAKGKGKGKGKAPYGPEATSTSSSSSSTNTWPSYTGSFVRPAGPYAASSSSTSPPEPTYRTGFR